MSKHAINAGQGEEVAPLAVTGLTATDVGTNMAYNNGAASLSWTLPSNSNPATLYTITSTPATTTQTTASTSYIFTGLASNTAYTFTVVPSNTHGSGPSTTSSSITATTVPQTPQSVSAADVGTNVAWGNAQANISFTAPATGGKAITSYTATNGTNSNTGTSSPINVVGMQGGTAYSFTMTATNANGTSAASNTASVTPTTVPGTPSAPANSSPAPGEGANVAGPSQDVTTWSAPDSGGSAITSYYLYDNGGAVGNVGNVTSYTINEGAGSNHYFQIAAINANGQGGTSGASSTVTTFSFTPFSFTPFGFTPHFGFTPFGFTPFGFTPFGFTPFGFTPFGFTPFGFTPFGFGYGNSLGYLTNVRTPNGLVAAANLQVGDEVLTANVDGLPTVDSLASLATLDAWTTTGAPYGNVTTKVIDIKTHMANTIIIINGEYFTEDHRFLVNRGGTVSVIAAVNISQDTDEIWSYASQAWEKISQLQVVENASYEVVSINTAPIQWFYTEDALVYDSASETVDFTQNPADATALSQDPTVGGIIPPQA